MKDETYLLIAETIAEHESKCISRKVGAVIVKNEQNYIDSIIGHGYNGTPRKQKNCCDVNAHMVHNGECGNFVSDEMKEAHHEWSQLHESHAEFNAIMNADTKDRIGSTLYCTLQPCYVCSILIANSGIARVVYREEYPRTPKESLQVLKDAGIEVLHLPKK